MKIKYEFVTDQAVELELEGKLAEEIMSIEKEIALSDRRETRRHESYSDGNDKTETIADYLTNVEADIIQNEEIRILYRAIASLLPEQQQLIRKVYFENRTLTEIANEEGVNKSSIHKRLVRIHTQLKKFLD